ncbi:unnamed protein product [Penicillium nalgiovense]|nr:unnamed protein product [Penicillium nalgiovense]
MTNLQILEIMPQKAALYLLHHVFLPPRIPQEEDHDAEHERFLLDNVFEALRRFKDYCIKEYFDILDMIITMTVRLKSVYALDGDVSEVELTKILENLKDKGKQQISLFSIESDWGSDGFLTIYIREQNAGILFSRCKNQIHVESFELSPRNESVTTTVGRLVCIFPGPGIALDLASFNESGLWETVAQTLSRMSYQPAANTKLKAKKAQQKHDEDRDTTNPKMVTELLMATLRPLSTDVSAVQIQKNTREEVIWRDSRSPWRRSALWLLMRVTLQLVFRRLSDEARLDDLYKQFMIFFMSFVVDKASMALPNEAIFCMNAKIARRLLKLELSDEPAWLTSVQNILRRSSRRIQGRWKQTMRENSRGIDTFSLSTLDFHHDIQCALPDLDRYLEGIERRGHDRPLGSNFQPPSKLHQYQREELPDCLEFHDLDYQRYSLVAFEDWVALHLNAWIEDHKKEQTSCSQLGQLMMQYHRAASLSYAHNPEAVSVMLLTLLELWVACDKAAIQSYDDLSKYDACIPVNCFQSLLLPFKSQMERLASAEKYLSKRQRSVKHHGAGIFHDYGSPSCFSVLYFNQSDEHQRLLEAIENHASRQRTKKKAELREKQENYRHLMELYSRTVCRYDEVILDAEYGFRESRHSSSCPCHRYLKEAKSIEINIHEWPLPTDHLQAKSTVFELKLPESFASWRDTTLFFLYNCLGVEYIAKERPRAEYRLQTYSGLSSFFHPHGGHSRVSLLSQNKPHQRTHRRNRLIVNVTENDVCLNNGLQFQYFDNVVKCYVGSFERTLWIEESCVYTLPQKSSTLQQFIFRSTRESHGPPPNLVIATQSAAPTDMLMEEYKALATMPLGLEIQWQNVLVELAADSIDLVFLRRIDMVYCLTLASDKVAQPAARVM